jgi:allantoicase
LIARLFRNWLFNRHLNQRLAARKLLRPVRQEAARKGWETRRSENHAH